MCIRDSSRYEPPLVIPVMLCVESIFCVIKIPLSTPIKSIVEETSHTIFQDLQSSSDIVIDLHSSNLQLMELPQVRIIKDFEKNMGEEVEYQRFRGNFYVSGLDAWEERSWIGKSININGAPFRVDDHIPRCSATNLKPKSSEITFNLPQKLKEFYDHIDLGVYLINDKENVPFFDKLDNDEFKFIYLLGADNINFETISKNFSEDFLVAIGSSDFK